MEKYGKSKNGKNTQFIVYRCFNFASNQGLYKRIATCENLINALMVATSDCKIFTENTQKLRKVISKTSIAEVFDDKTKTFAKCQLNYYYIPTTDKAIWYKIELL